MLSFNNPFSKKTNSDNTEFDIDDILGENDNNTEEDITRIENTTTSIGENERKNIQSNQDELQFVLSNPSDSYTEPKKLRKYFPAAIIIFLAIILGFLYAKTSSLIDSYSNAVYPEVYFENINLSGLSKDELDSKMDEILSQISNKEITVDINGNYFKYLYSDFEVNFDKDTLLKTILDYGKDTSFLGKYNNITKPKRKDFSTTLNYNLDIITNSVNTISETVKMEPTNATIDITSGVPNITSEIYGHSLMKEDLISKIENSITMVLNDSEILIEGTLQQETPAILAEQLRTINSIIGDHTTYFPIGPSGYNIAQGAAYVNNTLLMPGDVFSCEAAIGPTTVERGFGYANTYVNGEVVPGLGGGVCQIASTLYNAELESGIIPTHRLNHMMPVTYVPLGLDATLADGLIDLRFVNEYDYPIVIRAYTSGGSLTIQFWSNENAKKGITYKPYTTTNNSLSVNTYLRGHDSNGNIVLDEYIDTSRYNPPSW